MSQTVDAPDRRSARRLSGSPGDRRSRPTQASRQASLGAEDPRALRRSRLVERQAGEGGSGCARRHMPPTRKRGAMSPAARVALTLSWDESNLGSVLCRAGLVREPQSGSSRARRSQQFTAGSHSRGLRATAMLAEGNYPLAIEKLDLAYELAQALRRSRHADACARGEGTRSREERRGLDQALELIDEATAAALSGEWIRTYYARLLHDHQLVPGCGRPPSRRRVDGGRQQGGATGST